MLFVRNDPEIIPHTASSKTAHQKGSAPRVKTAETKFIF